MAEEQVETPIPAPKSAKKNTSYSKTGKLVMDAILNLNERKGSSIMKIRNYISVNNPDIDMNRYGKIVKKFILSALEKGELKKNDDTKGPRGFFKIVDKKHIKQSKKSKEQKENSSGDEEATTSKVKPSKNVSSPKMKKPIKKTIKMPSAVTATTTIKKSKPKAKASPTESDKEQLSKDKKKASGTKRSKKNEDEATVPKKTAKVEKPKAKAKPKKAMKDVEPNEDLENVQSEVAEKVPKGKKKAVKERVEPEEVIKTADKTPKGKKKAVKDASEHQETETIEKSKGKKKVETAVKNKKVVKEAKDENKD